jgi:peptide/nickel transport system permease protein
MPWAIRRIAQALAMILIATIVLVIVVHLLPGDPLAAVLQDRTVDPATMAALRERFGTDRSVIESLAAFLSGLIRGDLGVSLAEQRPVTVLLSERLGPTLLLGGLTLLVNFSVGLGLGLWTALNPTTWRARLISFTTLITYTIPAFVIGMVLVWLFSSHWSWLPVAGMSDALLSESASGVTIVLDRARHLALPLLTMVLATIAVPIRHQRAAALETRNADWVVAARARGVSRSVLTLQHIWRPALTPIVSLLGLWLPMLVTGAVFVESIFAWNGLGSLIAEATALRDIPVVIGAGILLVVMVQLGSLVADLLYRMVNPVMDQS